MSVAVLGKWLGSRCVSFCLWKVGGDGDGGFMLWENLGFIHCGVVA